jgi:signal transduction histidine kinase
MSPAGALPGHDPPMRVETVHECEHTRVTRMFFPGRAFVCKEPLGAEAERRLRHEVAMLERLHGVPGIAQLVEEAPRRPEAIVMADAGAVSLAGRASPMPVDDLIGLAVKLARAVAGMHRRGVMHRDITPGNIVISADGTPCLVDFALATSIAEVLPEFAQDDEIVGTLAYLAPEQTGRTGRPVDQRADLYALGATLYELATGEPPFGAGDPLQLTHDHLARMPVPPAEVNPVVSRPLSEIILHLLEKEPDHRYQSADGVVHDLERLQQTRTQPAAVVRVGERDLPLRLLPPSRLVGRDDEVAALAAAFRDALRGRCRGVLVSGVAGVGKTALVDQLRPVVTGGDGWFVAGKFDQYRRDLEFDAVHQALRALGRLLLAEPEDELVRVRERIRATVGPNAGLLAAVVPEFATLLAVPPEAGDPLTAQLRAPRSALGVLRAVASRERPVVLFLDDLQWAGRTPLGLVDLLLSEEPVEGLLLVGAYRDGESDTAHPVSLPLSRWRDQAGVSWLRLANLNAPSLAVMVAEMLHTVRSIAAGLVEVIEPHTSGNPYETVELLNALRRDGVVVATADGLRWDEAAVRAHLDRSEVAGLLTARVEGMPPTSRRLVEAMACLGGRAEMSVLQVVTGDSAPVVEQRLAPALADGVLVLEPGAQEVVRFRHDRTREVILSGLEPRRRRTLQLAMARQLAAVPGLFAVAAEQYLPVVDEIGDPVERRQVAGVLRRAAHQATLIGDYALVNALLGAAVLLLAPEETTALIEMHTGRHAALFSMGRLDEADEEYRALDGLCATTMERAAATRVQVRSLTHRNRYAEAIGLGLVSLRELGVTVPPPDRLPVEISKQLDHHLYRWLDHTDATDDLARPETTDPTLLAAIGLIDAVVPAAYYTDQARYVWLSLEALRIWIEHGPSRGLVGLASHTAFAVMALRDDHSAGRRALRRIIEAGEARGYEPGTSQARLLLALHNCWFEPIEDGVHVAARAREGLLRGGDLAYAGYSYYTTAYYVLDCAPSLDVVVAEVTAGLEFARRTGSTQTGEALDSYRWLAAALRGEPSAVLDETAADRYADNPLALLHAHVNRAIAAAVFDDQAGLARHTAAAMPLLSAAVGNYPTALAHVLRGLALAGQARATDGGQRGEHVSELEDVTRWVADRAADAPPNFLHLLRLVEAERAWAVDDFRAAVLAFDAAIRAVATRPRPWHRALTAERAGRFLLAHGVEHVGRELLAQARRDYAAWGASAKVDQMDRAYPTLRSEPAPTVGLRADQPTGPPQGRATVTAETLDLLGIVSASQALSSETSLERLHSRVVEVLSAMTGATGVHLLMWRDDRHEWLLSAPGRGGAVPLADTGSEHVVPMSVLRYVQRTGEPLVVGDASDDDRFARDPYFTDVACCSLLAVPILGRGTLRALLLLENRLIRGAFTVERLDAVKLIAGQLAVSLDNAQLYSELTASRARIVAAADESRRRLERDLHDGAQHRLVSLALRLQEVQAAAPPEADGLAAELDHLVVELTGALDELRELARGIHPAILAEGGLPHALKALARRCTVPVELEVRVDSRPSEPIEIAVYYLVSEALTNVAKHAGASAVRVEVGTDDAGATLRVEVRDDGRGGADFAGGSGMAGLKDRVEALGGRLAVQSAPGTGTTVRAELPFDPALAVDG